MEFDQNAQLDTTQIQDRRGSGGGGGGGGGLGGMFGGSGGKVAAGGGGLGIIGLILALVFGGGNVFGGSSGNNVFPTQAPAASSENSGTDSVNASCKTGADANTRQDCLIVGVVNSTQNYWAAEFSRSGLEYKLADTELFSGSTQTACGGATAAVGPFYCPGDQKVYIDLDFFAELESKFGASGGDFAKAYVVAHEYGHHVQNLLGTSAKVERAGNKTGANSGSVRLELQADCYAGVWANHATTEPQGTTGRPLIVNLTQKDIDDALSAAKAVGDDWIQKRFQGQVNPDTFTHGTSAQRQKWFMTGYQTGDATKCDTFSGSI